MTPYYADDWLTVYHGDARAVLAELPAESVHCVVTSPPYWGLRDYGTAAWSGGDEGCDHLRPVQPRNDRPKGTFHGGTDEGDYAREPNYKGVCGKCGAIRQDSQLGLEPTPEQYVENMVAVFREVRRVLRSDGTCWVNLGDSYISGQGGRQSAAGACRGTIRQDRPTPKPRPELENAPSGWAERAVTPRTYPAANNAYGWKPKDLAGIPWRVAFALQADGWYLRSDIIWSKPNPMPESVTDRPTKSHEYLFLLSKSARYYYDADAVREDAKRASAERYAAGYKQFGVGQFNGSPTDKRGPKEIPAERLKHLTGRNLRSVWSIATAPYPGAHFATFPPKLVEPCIKAGTSEKGVCPECGAPWVREVISVASGRNGRGVPSGEWDETRGIPRHRAAMRFGESSTETTGWLPGCNHTVLSIPADPESWLGPNPFLYPQAAVVLDPFAGSGTTGMVAQSLSRRAVLIDLSMDYLGQLMERNRDIPLGLAESSA